MKTFNFLSKKLSLGLVAFLSIGANAQTLTIQDVTPGKFNEAYSNAGGSFWNYSEVIVKGSLNYTDFDVIKNSTHLLQENSSFDLSGTTLVDDSGNTTHELFEEAFNGVKTANASITFILPTSITHTAHKSFAGFEGKVVAPGLKYIASQCFAWNRKLGSFELFENITEIASMGFGWCDQQGDNPGLTDIIIGEKIEIIGENAFQDCNALKEVTIKAVTPPAFTNLGAGVGKLYGEDFKPVLYVPAGSLNDYKAIDAFNNTFSEIQPIVANSVLTKTETTVTACLDNDNLIVSNVNLGTVITITDLQGRIITKDTVNGNSWNKTLNATGVLFIYVCQPAQKPTTLKVIR